MLQKLKKTPLNIDHVCFSLCATIPFSDPEREKLENQPFSISSTHTHTVAHCVIICVCKLVCVWVYWKVWVNGSVLSVLHKGSQSRVVKSPAACKFNSTFQPFTFICFIFLSLSFTLFMWMHVCVKQYNIKTELILTKITFCNSNRSKSKSKLFTCEMWLLLSWIHFSQSGSTVYFCDIIVNYSNNNTNTL